MKFASLIIMTSLVAGCVTAGHGGRITAKKGLEATCAGACAAYKSDGTGCAKFHGDTAAACATYFTELCNSTPSQCKAPADRE